MTTLVHAVVQRLYDTFVRERLPLTMGSAAGVPVLYPRLLDATKNFPDYKQGLIRAIHDHCEGRPVTLVGLGRGVSTIHCLRAGATRVDAYEASETMIGIADQTFAACPYEPTERVSVHHNVVGEAVEIYGDGIGSSVPESELPANDVLIMDCEGAERSILDGLPADLSGSVAIVETHPERGVPTDETRARLERLYRTVRERDYMLEDDRGKRVLVGLA
jgi:hypothetical protein